MYTRLHALHCYINRDRFSIDFKFPLNFVVCCIYMYILLFLLLFCVGYEISPSFVKQFQCFFCCWKASTSDVVSLRFELNISKGTKSGNE